MAPEWTEIEKFDRKCLKCLDIYALGIILSDLLCNPVTSME